MGDNPFSSLFNPDKQGTLTGFIGQAMGNPGAANASAKAIGQLSQIMQEGGEAMTPQRAIIQFMSTQEGQTLMATPGALPTVLKDFSAAVTPPNPTAILTSPGGTTDMFQGGRNIGSRSVPTTATQDYESGVPQAVPTAPGGKNTILQKGQPTQTITNPTTDLQNFSGFTSQMGTLPPETMQAIAQAQLLPHDSQQKAMSMQALVQKGLDPKIAHMFMVGAYEIKEVLNPYGDKVGQWSIVNKLDPASPAQLITPNTNQVGQGGTGSGGNEVTPTGRNVPGAVRPPIPPDAVNPDGSININKVFKDPKLGMFLGAGSAPAIQSYAGSLVRQANPSAADGDSLLAEQRRNQGQVLNTAIAEMGSSKKFASLGKEWQKLGFQYGPLESTLGSLDRALTLHKAVTDSYASNEATRKDLRLPAKVRIDAEEDKVKLQGILDALPASPDMMQMRQDIIEHKVNPPSLPGIAGGLVNSGRELLKGGMQGVNNLTGAPGQQQPQANADAGHQNIIKALPNMSIEALNSLDIRGLPPQVQDAVIARAKSLLTAPKVGKLNYGEEQPASGVQQFMQNPDGRRSPSNKPANTGQPGTRKQRGNLSDEKLMSIHVDVNK